MKIRLVGAEVFRADGQTDMTKLKVAFRNFTNAPKHGILCSVSQYIMGSGQSDFHNLKETNQPVADAASCKIRPSNKLFFRNFHNF